METSRISSVPYRARVRRLSKSQLSSVHRTTSVRSRPIAKVRRIPPAPQRLSQHDSQSAHHVTNIDFELTSDIMPSRISSTSSWLPIKRIDRRNIQSTQYHRRVMPLDQLGSLSADLSRNATTRATQVSIASTTSTSATTTSTTTTATT
ncbi:unnamed protein product, partial [Adineta steineri]